MPYVGSRPAPAPTPTSCGSPVAASRCYRGRRQYRQQQQQWEAKPGSPSNSSSSSTSYASFVTATDNATQSQLSFNPSSLSSNNNGVLLTTIRALSRRNRFPVNEDRLPLSMTNDLAHFISFRVLDPSKSDFPPSTVAVSANSDKHQRVKVSMLCFNTRTDSVPMYEIPLAGAIMVARTCSGYGPCLYIAASSGTFEFQCPPCGAYDYTFWEPQMRYLGVKIVSPQDLFAITDEEPIGSGSFSKVYNATHKGTGTDVAIKLVEKEKVSTLPQDYPSAVHIEIDVLRRIRHPYIVHFQAAFEDDLYYFIVLESLRGGNVCRWLQSHRVYTEQQAKITMCRVLSALAALEDEKIVHRDLKLENIMLENPGDPTSIKLIDFGLAAYLDTPRMSMHCGSPGFVAPEIITKQKSHDCRADMFSAGVFLYTILTGTFPFHTEGDRQSRTLIRNESCLYSMDIPPWKNVSNEAKDLVKLLLTKDPAARPSAAQALAHIWFIGRVRSFTFPQSIQQSSNNNHPYQFPHPTTIIQQQSSNNHHHHNHQQLVTLMRPPTYQAAAATTASFPQQQQQMQNQQMQNQQIIVPFDSRCCSDGSTACSSSCVSSLYDPSIAFHGCPNVVTGCPNNMSGCPNLVTGCPNVLPPTVLSNNVWVSLGPTDHINHYNYAVVSRLALISNPPAAANNNGTCYSGSATVSTGSNTPAYDDEATNNNDNTTLQNQSTTNHPLASHYCGGSNSGSSSRSTSVRTSNSSSSIIPDVDENNNNNEPLGMSSVAAGDDQQQQTTNNGCCHLCKSLSLSHCLWHSDAAAEIVTTW